MKDQKKGDKQYYLDGFWLNKNTFIKADNAKITNVGRSIKTPYKKNNAKIIIFENAVEMVVDNTKKIIGVKKHVRMGLWLDTVNSVEKTNM